MNYLELINNYWDMREQGILSANEGDYYLFLIHKCNRLSWKNPFNLSNQLCCGYLGIQEKSLIKYRNKLKQIGLIDFKPGIKGRNTEYQIHLPKYCKKYSESGSLSGSQVGSESGSLSGIQAPDYIKQETNTKLNETKLTPKGVDESPLADSPQDSFSLYKNLKKEKKAIVGFIRSYKPLFIEPYVDLWNLFADEKKLAKVSKLSDSRKRKFKVRICEKSFDFIQVLKKAAESQFLLTGKWFCFDWIIENESNYLKVIEGNYDNYDNHTSSSSAHIQTSAAKDFNISIKKDVNYLFERFVENETYVTVISIDEVHFNELYKDGFMNVIQSEIPQIECKAREKLNGHCDESKLKLMTKKMSVIECFRHLKNNGYSTIFNL